MVESGLTMANSARSILWAPAAGGELAGEPEPPPPPHDCSRSSVASMPNAFKAAPIIGKPLYVPMAERRHAIRDCRVIGSLRFAVLAGAGSEGVIAEQLLEFLRARRQRAIRLEALDGAVQRLELRERRERVIQDHRGI